VFGGQSPWRVHCVQKYVLTLFLNCLQTQGNVGKWKKKEGDLVAAGDVLCDIETDKATLDFESLEDGVLAKILIPAGTKDIPVGQALCVVAESKEGLEKFTSYSQEEDGRTASQASQPQEQARSSSHSPPPHPSFPLVDLPPHEVLSMPALSPTMTQGNVGTWKKKEGDKVAAGDVLCDIETDKATLDFESLEDGYVLVTVLATFILVCNRSTFKTQ
jgi:pyruvate dehydrogenase E2 component (dihydrolipoamide acetyltransferase)